MRIAARLASLLLALLPSATRADDPPAPSRWITPQVQAPRVSFHTFDSPMAGEPVSYHLFRPAAYEAEPDRRFPVVYWLHGSGGGQAGISRLATLFDQAIDAGDCPPCLVVFVNGLTDGMYVDWKDGSTPLEQVIVRDLLDHIDSSYRTIASREGRILDGFSMGGYGAARLGFKYPDLFGAISIMGAGPMQAELRGTPRASGRRARQILQRVYGGDQAYFRAVSPLRLAEQNAARLDDSLIRIVIGDEDETLPANIRFREHLEQLGIAHRWTLLPGVGHNPMAVIRALGDDHWAFYREALAGPVRR